MVVAGKPDAKGLSQLGEVMQIAFVPEDFDAAVRHWTAVMGVGPFHLLEDVRLEAMRYRGAPSAAAFDLALAYWGDMQVELIRPRDGHPSIYTGEYADVGGGLHHVCILVDDIADARRVCAARGAEVVLEGALGDSRVIYVDPGQGPGSLVEILQQGGEGPRLFAAIKAACAEWDGSEPLRRLG
ncbi:VOC family protein [Erythrobacter sp. HL-111]|uniref:VOC family protein n=1 Tax=Erythrobacter sp. HL-111 TaxID=1798193 RepID=UPI0006D987AB|nr:VOC family protein [Erythrobacter sp. HL-111]KPP95422.1 MAG: Glyoxalase/Bleomycin resistance protein/Dioxygenase superfamily [Erythrobacteraceae bacterium HL-111]SDS69735.1 Glyoxalase/Bleomycin resistance protein/Dioxygenase superfamily protein [Erythrobacter sp. HL-111]